MVTRVSQLISNSQLHLIVSKVWSHDTAGYCQSLKAVWGQKIKIIKNPKLIKTPIFTLLLIKNDENFEHFGPLCRQGLLQ